MIALYRGTSAMSRAIRFLNWSDYSHAAWITRNGTCIEAVITEPMKLRGLVCESPCFDTRHTPGTVVDFFTIPGMTDEQHSQIETLLRKEIGQPYDFRGILKFLSRKEGASDDKWFCSELVFQKLLEVFIVLLRLPSWKVYPAMLSYSTHIQPAYSLTCGEK